MPFIQSPKIDSQKTLFYTLTAATSHVGVSFITQKWAEKFAQQNKKVLIFDALLGLQNFPQNNPNQEQIPDVLAGLAPLTNLRTSSKQGWDVITGLANQNLNAQSIATQERVKNDLCQLATNYDIVLIDCPAAVTASIFQNLGIHIWVSTPQQHILLKTLRLIALETTPSLILNQVQNETEYRDLCLFVKNLLPQCQLIEFFEQKNS